MIVKQKGLWVVKAKTGKVMGRYKTKAKAEARLKQVEMFKHMEKKS